MHLRSDDNPRRPSRTGHRLAFRQAEVEEAVVICWLFVRQVCQHLDWRQFAYLNDSDDDTGTARCRCGRLFTWTWDQRDGAMVRIFNGLAPNLCWEKSK